MSFYFPNVDPTFIFKRTGTNEDPYIFRHETHQINNSYITLMEIPNPVNKVTIKKLDNTSLTEVTSATLLANQYRVDYSTGIVYFHESLEKVTVTCDFYGMGMMSFPSSRVWVDTSDTSNIKTLQQAFTDIDNLKTNWLTAVANYASISTTYTNPKIGDTVQTTNDGRIYRFNGSTWVNTQQYTDSAITDIQSRLDGISKVPNKYEWMSTEGQIVYQLPDGSNLIDKWLEVTIGGASLPNSLVRIDSPTQFTLLVSSTEIPTGIKVAATWFEPFIPTAMAHKSTHEKGGSDEIDVTKLKNYQESIVTPLTEKVKSTNIKEIRDNSNIFEYSLDGTVWKQVQSTSSNGFALINDYGADPTGVNDSLAAFNSALATGKPVTALNGTYKVTGTVVVPRKGTLILNAGVIIKPSGNFNVIQIKPESKIYGNGCKIDTSGISSFTMAGIYATGQDRFSVAGELTIVNGFNIIGKDHEGDVGATSTSYTGKGIHFYSGDNWAAGYSGQAYIAYVQVSNINIGNFYRGIWIEREQAPINGNPWITSCTFDQINMYACMRSIDITTNDSFYNGGHLFTNLQLQANDYNERYVYSDGSNNIFQGEFWDLETYFEPRNVPCFEFSATAHENIINGTQFFALDKHVIDRNMVSGGNPMKPNRFNSLTNPVNIIPPVITNNIRNFIGDQDDILAGASKTYTVTKTSAHVSGGGTIDAMFQPNKGSYYSLSGVDENNNCIIEIDCSSNPISEIDMMGFVFRQDSNNYIPKYIKMDLLDSGGAVLATKSITNNTQGFVYFSTYASSTYKIRLTFGSSNDVTVNRRIRIYRIFATAIGLSGKTWLNTAEGGTLYGNLNMNKNKTTNFVLDSGDMANRPTNPVVGQVFYDTSLGKPIYCKVGGVSPTWTDANGATV